MNKKNCQDVKKKLSESIDPRFSGIFGQQKNTEEILNSCEGKNQRKNLSSAVSSKKNHTVSDFLSTKLAEYLDSHIKEVVRSTTPTTVLSEMQVSKIRLFKDSQLITGDEEVIAEKKPVKKKHKKHKVSKKELVEVAVTPEWILQQAKIFNS